MSSYQTEGPFVQGELLWAIAFDGLELVEYVNLDPDTNLHVVMHYDVWERKTTTDVTTVHEDNLARESGWGDLAAKWFKMKGISRQQILDALEDL